ncbi:MAG: hypothetical protein ABI892_09060 [Flavobacterium sp.]
MKGFIKVTDINNQEHYLNINYIMKFSPLNKDYDGKTMVYVHGNEKITIIQSNNTVEEIIEMIDLAS